MGIKVESVVESLELTGEPLCGVESSSRWGSRTHVVDALDAFLSGFGFTRHGSLVIPGNPPNVNTLIAQIKIHWAVYAKFKKKETNDAAIFCRKAKLKKLNGPIFTLIEWFCPNKKVDPDGYRAGPRIKGVLDGMKDYGAIENDGWAMFGDGFLDLFWIDKKNPRVELTFYERKP